MNVKETILLKKLIAGFFLALFLFIHIAKVTHHHCLNQTISKDADNRGPHVTNCSDCPICDYQLVKDAQQHSESLSITSTEAHHPAYSFYRAPFITSIGSTSSGRGPPSLS